MREQFFSKDTGRSVSSIGSGADSKCRQAIAGVYWILVCVIGREDKKEELRSGCRVPCMSK